MKKYFLLFTVTFTIFFACKNETGKRDELLKNIVKDTSNYTLIKWIDTAFDLGTINSGDKKELKYKFVNVGSKPLVLGNVTAGCGCTVASFSKDEIMPGQEGWVTAKFDSHKQCDDVTKYVTVPSNAKNDTLRTLNFKAHIINCESNDKVVLPTHPETN